MTNKCKLLRGSAVGGGGGVANNERDNGGIDRDRVDDAA